MSEQGRGVKGMRVFSRCDLGRMYLFMRVMAARQNVNLLSWLRNGYTLQSHIEMTLIKLIV